MLFSASGFLCNIGYSTTESPVLDLLYNLKHIVMQANVGTTDQVIRLILAAGLVAIALMLPVGTVSILLFVLAGVAALTAIIRFCPLYVLFGWNTCRKKS